MYVNWGVQKQQNAHNLPLEARVKGFLRHRSIDLKFTVKNEERTSSTTQGDIAEGAAGGTVQTHDFSTFSFSG